MGKIRNCGHHSHPHVHAHYAVPPKEKHSKADQAYKHVRKSLVPHRVVDSRPLKETHEIRLIPSHSLPPRSSIGKIALVALLSFLAIGVPHEAKADLGFMRENGVAFTFDDNPRPGDLFINHGVERNAFGELTNRFGNRIVKDSITREYREERIFTGAAEPFPAPARWVPPPIEAPRPVIIPTKQLRKEVIQVRAGVPAINEEGDCVIGEEGRKTEFENLYALCCRVSILGDVSVKDKAVIGAKPCGNTVTRVGVYTADMFNTIHSGSGDIVLYPDSKLGTSFGFYAAPGGKLLTGKNSVIYGEKYLNLHARDIETFLSKIILGEGKKPTEAEIAMKYKEAVADLRAIADTPQLKSGVLHCASHKDVWTETKHDCFIGSKSTFPMQFGTIVRRKGRIVLGGNLHFSLLFLSASKGGSGGTGVFENEANNVPASSPGDIVLLPGTKITVDHGYCLIPEGKLLFGEGASIEGKELSHGDWVSFETARHWFDEETDTELLQDGFAALDARLTKAMEEAKSDAKEL